MSDSWQKIIDEKHKALLNGEGKEPVNILAIETSCDETAVAVVQNGNVILSNIISSQIDIHKKFGGVVPEVASRKHVESINYILEDALVKANLKLSDITAIAVTNGPGLIGALLVGVAAAKAIAYSMGIPLIGVHHIAGHIYANHLVKPLEYPLVALVVSGGHTELVYMQKHNSFEILGQTRDDAVGEAFDKVARTLGLPYPGGPQIDRLAIAGKETIKLPRALMDDSYDFSFSGLKSAVINILHNAKQKGENIKQEDMAASFQRAVIDVLVGKTLKAIKDKQVNQLIIAGGVAANQGLRAELQQKSTEHGINLTIPPLRLCTDNAAMIACAGYYSYIQGKWSGLDLNGSANIPLPK